MWKLFLLFAAFAALQGCADFLPDNSRPAEKLGLCFVEDGPYTKSGTPIPQGVVEDVNVYVFGEGGELLCSRFFRGEDVFIGDLQVSPGKEYSVYSDLQELGCGFIQELECSSAGLEQGDMALVRLTLSEVKYKNSSCVIGKIKNIELISEILFHEQGSF